MKYFNLLVVLIAFSLSASASTQTNNVKNMCSQVVGRWKGEIQIPNLPNTFQKWDAIYRSNGTTIVKFQYQVDGEYSEDIEKGTWGCLNNVLFKHHTNVADDGTRKYKLHHVGKNKMVYTIMTTEEPWNKLKFVSYRVK
ncbi:hypothetical protein [Parashewanella tropica]|uniref:hypothetical protein n=1 Tax=Parashewanella tropica TaxID=2547970 RepID=UPI0010593423|nr:hypothetical protein [Parashewanella tropica]